MMSTRLLYEHRQTGWPIVGAALLALVCMVAVQLAAPSPARTLLPKLLELLGLPAAIAICFGWLTVFVTETHLAARFGIGLFRRTIRLDRIRRVSVGTTRWYEGWGIHWTRRGMLYNVGGFDAVVVELDDGGTLRIGSDDPQRLCATIDQALRARDRRRP